MTVTPVFLIVWLLISLTTAILLRPWPITLVIRWLTPSCVLNWLISPTIVLVLVVSIISAICSLITTIPSLVATPALILIWLLAPSIFLWISRLVVHSLILLSISWVVLAWPGVQHSFKSNKQFLLAGLSIMIKINLSESLLCFPLVNSSRVVHDVKEIIEKEDKLIRS